MSELHHVNMELLSTFINRAGRAYAAYAADNGGYFSVHVPEYLNEDSVLAVNAHRVANLGSHTDADLVAHELNRYIVATKKLLGVAP